MQMCCMKSHLMGFFPSTARNQRDLSAKNPRTKVYRDSYPHSQQLVGTFKIPTRATGCYGSVCLTAKTQLEKKIPTGICTTQNKNIVLPCIQVLAWLACNCRQELLDAHPIFKKRQCRRISHVDQKKLPRAQMLRPRSIGNTSDPGSDRGFFANSGESHTIRGQQNADYSESCHSTQLQNGGVWPWHSTHAQFFHCA